MTLSLYFTSLTSCFVFVVLPLVAGNPFHTIHQVIESLGTTRSPYPKPSLQYNILRAVERWRVVMLDFPSLSTSPVQCELNELCLFGGSGQDARVG